MFAKRPFATSRIGLLLAVAIQLASIASSGRVESLKVSPIEVESEELPSNVVPLEYNVEMVFMDNKGTLGRGKVEILFKVGRPSSSQKLDNSLLRLMAGKKSATNDQRDRLVLHLRHHTFEIPEFDDVITANSLEAARSRDGQRVQVKEVKVSEYYRLLVVELDRSLREGSFGLIKLSYRIRDNTNELQNSKQNPLVHSYPGEVYRLFPCLDEPHFKSKLRLTVDQPDSGMRIIAGTEPEPIATGSNWERVTFQQTPVAVPLHSLAFAFVPASKAHKSSYPIDDSRMVLAYGSEAQLKRSEFALEFAAAGVKWMEEYLGVRHRLPVDLRLVPLAAHTSTHIGSDAHAGLGLGAINEDFLLVNEELSSLDRKTESAFEVALVVARQWFGTELTPRTRADFWITEGLAAYMALRMVRELTPQFGVDQYFNSVMRAQIAGQSGNNRNRRRLIKGAQLIDMLRRDVAKSEKDFDSLIRSLFDQQQQQHVSVLDLARTFASNELDQNKLLEIIRLRAKQCDQTFEPTPDPWLELDIEGNHLVTELYQEDNALLPVALKVKLSNADGSKQILHEIKLDSFSKAKPRVSFELPSWFGLLEPASDWLIVSQADDEALTNFRVRYSDKLLERLRGPLKEGNKLLRPRERIDIVAGEAESLKVADYRDQTKERLARVVEMFGAESQAEVLLELLQLIEALAAESPGGGVFLKKAGQYRDFIKAHERKEASDERLKSALLKSLFEHGDAEAIEWALQRFRRTRLTKSLLGAQTEIIHEIVARAGDWDDRNNLAYWLTQGKPFDEAIRIFEELNVSK